MLVRYLWWKTILLSNLWIEWNGKRNILVGQPEIISKQIILTLFNLAPNFLLKFKIVSKAIRGVFRKRGWQNRCFSSRGGIVFAPKFSMIFPISLALLTIFHSFILLFSNCGGGARAKDILSPPEYAPERKLPLKIVLYTNFIVLVDPCAFNGNLI